MTFDIESLETWAKEKGHYMVVEAIARFRAYVASRKEHETAALIERTEGSEMRRLNILYRTSENRGDHAADVSIAITPLEGETVDGLVARCLNEWAGCDWIELRISLPLPKPPEQQP